MPAFISKKLSFALLFCSWCIAFATIFSLNYALSGPKLGPLYDTLLGFRSPPPVSAEILLIETNELIEPADIFSVLMTVSEMGASDLLVEVPLLGTGSVVAETGVEFSYRINNEFDLLQRNIRSLFDAIRLGSLSPADAPSYVESVVDLAQQGRDRLNSAIIRQDESGAVLASQAAQVFGHAIMAEDLRPVPAEDISWYSRPRPDRDGRLRRIAPITEEAEHIVYRALKRRWEESILESGEKGLVLINILKKQNNEEEGVEVRFPLDDDGNILIEHPGLGDFRRLSLNSFRDYDQAGRVLARLLKDAESLGVYAETRPERMPHILFDYAESLKDDLLKAPTQAKRESWIQAREDYFASLEQFLNGPSESALVNGYEELIVTERLGDEGVARLRGMRDELIRSFAAMRAAYRELAGLRSVLALALDSSFCIMGPQATVTESSALLANALLTGRSIAPGQEKYILLLPSAVSFAVLACIHALGPVLLLLGLAASLLGGAAFSAAFIFGGCWIDPLIPAAACLAGTLFLAVSRFCIGYGRMLRFRLAYSSSVNSKMLKRLIKTGRPLLSETSCVPAVIIAAKNPGMTGREDRESPIESAKAAAKFRQDFSTLFRQRGALVLGFENDIALACFGSPPQRVCEKELLHPMAKAVPCVREILESPLSAEWYFGMEAGECAFFWSGKAGHTASGHAAARARILASLALRYKVRALIGESAREASGRPMKKIALLSGEGFYELPV
jgi:hypothetical protein